MTEKEETGLLDVFMVLNQKVNFYDKKLDSIKTLEIMPGSIPEEPLIRGKLEAYKTATLYLERYIKTYIKRRLK